MNNRIQGRWFYYAVAFFSGMSVLGIEVATSRLIGAILGTSDLVWSAVIALVLVYLTVGYFLGGRLADRYPQPGVFFTLLAWAAFTAGLLPVIARPLMLSMANAFSLANLNIVLLAIIGITVALLFAIPITLLGCVSPYILRLMVEDTESSGRTAGQVYAISTFGSIIGNFAPVLILIPVIGTSWTFGVFSFVLLALALVGLWQSSSPHLWQLAWMPVLLPLLILFGVRGPVKEAPPGTTLLFEAETAYNYVQVVEVDDNVVVSGQPPGTRFLLLNEGQGVHSVYHPEQLQTQATWDMFLAAPYFNVAPYDPGELDQVAIIGLAAGTIAQQYTAVYGPVNITGVEIDPGIVQAGYDYFAMTMPNLEVITDDGRYALAQMGSDYDLIAIDAYRVPYIPWHLTTVEFFTEVHDHLADDGIVMINVGRAAEDRRFVDAIAATMQEVFPTLHAIDVPYSFNTMIVGTMRATSIQNLSDNLDGLPVDSHPLLRDTLALAYDSLVQVVSSEVIFTDDRAPVETMINAMILDFVVGDAGLSQLTG